MKKKRLLALFLGVVLLSASCNFDWNKKTTPSTTSSSSTSTSSEISSSQPSSSQTSQESTQSSKDSGTTVIPAPPVDDSYTKELQLVTKPKTNYSRFETFNTNGIRVDEKTFKKNTTIETATETLTNDKFEYRLWKKGQPELNNDNYTDYPKIVSSGINAYEFLETGDYRIYIRSFSSSSPIYYEIFVYDVGNYVSNLLIDTSSLSQDEQSVLRKTSITDPVKKFENISINYTASYNGLSDGQLKKITYHVSLQDVYFTVFDQDIETYTFNTTGTYPIKASFVGKNGETVSNTFTVHVTENRPDYNWVSEGNMTLKITNTTVNSADKCYYSPEEVTISHTLSTINSTRKIADKDYPIISNQETLIPSKGDTKALVIPLVIPDYLLKNDGRTDNENSTADYVPSYSPYRTYYRANATEMLWENLQKACFGYNNSNTYGTVSSPLDDTVSDGMFESLSSYYKKSSFRQLSITGMLTEFLSMEDEVDNLKEEAKKEFDTVRKEELLSVADSLDDYVKAFKVLAPDMESVFSDDIIDKERSKNITIEKDDGTTRRGDFSLNNLIPILAKWASVKYRISLKNYDSNEDGYIDNIHCIYVGHNESVLNDSVLKKSDSVWGDFASTTSLEPDVDNPVAKNYTFTSASSTIYGYGLTVDNKRVDERNIYYGPRSKNLIYLTGRQLGLNNYSNTIANVGDVSYENYSALGNNDMMDAYVGDHNPYSKMILGWIKPYVVYGNVNSLTISSSQEENSIIVISENNKTYRKDDMTNTVYFNPFSEYIMLDYYRKDNLNKIYEDSNSLIDVKPVQKNGLRVYHVDGRLAKFAYDDTTSSYSTFIDFVDLDSEITSSAYYETIDSTDLPKYYYRRIITNSPQESTYTSDVLHNRFDEIRFIRADQNIADKTDNQITADSDVLFNETNKQFNINNYNYYRQMNIYDESNHLVKFNNNSYFNFIIDILSIDGVSL